MVDGIELDEKSKLKVSVNWMKCGSPKGYEPRLIAKLGEDWETYMNPYLHKLTDSKLDNLVKSIPMEYNFLVGEKFKPLVRYILEEKLNKLEYDIAPNGFTSSKTMNVETDVRKSMSYKITSVGNKRELMRVDLEAIGYKYTPRIYLLETGVELSSELTEGSLNNLKGLMYYMSDEGTWSLGKLNQSLSLIEFRSEILNSIMGAIRSKYDK